MSPGLVSATPWNHADSSHSTSFETASKVKFDRQIVAIARVLQASIIYTDDENLAATASAVGISTLGLADLPLPPETAQGQLPFESNKTDTIDEIAQQAENLQEPPVPNEPPAAQ